MCPRCKRQNPQDAVYCENCGSDLAPAGGTPAKRATKVEDVGSPAPAPLPASGGEFWRPAGGPAAAPKRSTMIEAGAAPEPAPVAAAAAVNDPFRPRDPFAVSVGNAPQPPPQPHGTPPQPPVKRSTVYGGTPAATPSADPFAVSAAPAPQADRKLIGVLITFNDAPNGKIFTLREGKNTIGRDDDRDIRLDDGRVSGKHACIQHRAGKTWVYDENSVNGTFLEDEDITTEKPAVQDGAVLRVGQTVFLVKLVDPARQAALWGDGKVK